MPMEREPRWDLLHAQSALYDPAADRSGAPLQKPAMGTRAVSGVAEAFLAAHFLKHLGRA